MRASRTLATLAAIAVLIAATGTTTLHSQGVPCGDESTTLVVSPSSLQSWQQQHAHCSGGTSTGSQAFVTGPATPPLGTGSLQFTIGADGNSFETVRYPNLDGVRIDSLTTLSYSTFVTNFNNGKAPYILLDIDFNGDSTLDDQIFFEPVYQSAAFFPSNPQGPPVQGQWQTWDALNGGWWSLNNICGAGPGVNVKSLATYLSCQPNARIINTATGQGGFRLATGCGGSAWANFDGNVDNLIIGIAGTCTTFNFEPDVVICPVCPDDVVQANDPNQCGAVVNYPPPTGCKGPVTCSPPSGSFFPVGPTTVTCDAGQSGSCSFTVTVQDAQPPMITCPANITKPADPNQCSAAVTYPTPTASDNCVCTAGASPRGSGCPVTCNPPSGSTFPTGTTTVTCTATDASNNQASCSFTVTVQETQPPTITCPPNQTKCNDPNQCGAVVNYPPPTASDNCPGVTTMCSPASGSFFPVGTTTVTCTATDASGNTATCTFTVKVNDCQPPTITCPPNQTAVTNQNVCPPPGQVPCQVVTFPPPTASDNCPGVTVVCNPPSGSCLPVGTTTVTCTATDASGNTATCTFTVTTFDVCLQDDSNPATVLLFNTFTGDYRFCCGGTTFTGKGKVTRQGCIFTLEHNPLDRRVRATADKAVFRGNASIQSPPGKLRCTITDGDIRNNTCVCQ